MPKKYQELERRAAALQALYRAHKKFTTQMKTSEVPTKAQVKRSGKGAFLRKDLVELAKHPAALNMYTSKETGCRVATTQEETRLNNSSANCNTTTFRAGR